MHANIRLEHQLLAVEDEHIVHAMLELTAPATPQSAPRPPVKIALVIDRSGSMAGEKLAVTKECAAYLVRRLAPTDELALITYDDEVQTLVPLSPVASAPFLPLIAAIPPGGSTNLSGGWLKAMEELRPRPGQTDGARKILLLTDGLANVGITDPKALVSLATNAAGQRIGTTTIGFGEGFDEELLTSMADAGGGNSHYAATPDQAPTIFAQEFEDLVKLVAQNMSVEIRPSAEVKMLGVLNEYPAVEVAGGVQVQLGDAYADETRRVVFQLHVPQMAALGVAKVADVVLRYVSVAEQIAAHDVTMPINVNMVSADEALGAEADREVVEEVVILKAARAQEEARKRADAGDVSGARETLSSAVGEVRAAAPGSARAEKLLEEAERLEANMGLLESYDASASKSMHYSTRQMRRRRQP